MSNLAIYLLNIEECHTLNQRLLSIFQTDLPEAAAEAKKIIPYLTNLDNDLSAIVTKATSNALTEQLILKDSARDEAFVGFRDYCKAFTKSPDKAKAQAAGTLVELIQRLGWTLYDDAYSEQTASQHALSEALAEPEYNAAVTTIGAQDWVDNLKATNADFEQTVKLRDEQASQKEVPLSQETKQSLNKYLKPLLSFIEIMAEIEPKTYAAAQAKIEEIVNNAMSVARSRRTRKDNQTEEAEPE